MADRGAIVRVHHLLARNSQIEFSDDSSKRLKIQGRGDSTSINMGYNWDPPRSVHEVVEAVLNYDLIYQAYDYSSKALIRYTIFCLAPSPHHITSPFPRVCHDVRYFGNLVENTKAGEKQQLKMFEKFCNDCFAQNAAAGSSGQPPVTYKKFLKVARQVISAEGFSDSSMFTGDIYCGATNKVEGRRDNTRDNTNNGRRDGDPRKPRDNSDR